LDQLSPDENRENLEKGGGKALFPARGGKKAPGIVGGATGGVKPGGMGVAGSLNPLNATADGVAGVLHATGGTSRLFGSLGEGLEGEKGLGDPEKKPGKKDGFSESHGD